MWHSRSNFYIAGVNTINICCLGTVRKKSSYPTKCVISNTIVLKVNLCDILSNALLKRPICPKQHDFSCCKDLYIIIFTCLISVLRHILLLIVLFALIIRFHKTVLPCQCYVTNGMEELG